MPVAALILGILGTILSLSVVGFFAGIPVGLVAIVCAVLARKKAIAENRAPGIATAGLVLGVFAVTAGIVLYGACTYINRRTADEFDKIAHDPKIHDTAQFDETADTLLAPARRDGGAKK